VTPEVGGSKGTAGSVVPGLSDEPGDGIDRGADLGAEGVFEVFTGDVCALGYIVGSCDGGLLRGSTHQVTRDSFGAFYVGRPGLSRCLWSAVVARSWPRFMSASPAVVSVRCGCPSMFGVVHCVLRVGRRCRGQSPFRAASDPANEAGRQIRRVLHSQAPRLSPRSAVGGMTEARTRWWDPPPDSMARCVAE
jgi:hypothetical protein